MTRKLGVQRLETRQLLAADHDLVAFAKELTDAGVVLYGAAWSPAVTQQRSLFEDGRRELSFVEVTNPDRTLGTVGIENGIDLFPTWELPGGERLRGVQSIEALSEATGIEIPTGDQPSFARVDDLTVFVGSPLHVPIDAYDPNGGPLSVTVAVDRPDLLTASVLSGNRSLAFEIHGYGEMVFELFEQRAPNATGRLAELALADFYDDIIFHRVIDDFVIQGGDPTGLGIGGSSLPDFDDDFHSELQHNRAGVLSWAKSADDTNNSQFFVTEVATRFLDFNHSVAGQLVEGEDVREAIGEHATNTADRPTVDIVISDARVFEDTENSVVLLKATGAGTGVANLTITLTDQDGNQYEQVVSVEIEEDSHNSQPFLDPFTAPLGAAGVPVKFQLTSTDVEGDRVAYSIQSFDDRVEATIDQNGMVTVTPRTAFVGTVELQATVRPLAGGGADSDNQAVVLTFVESLGIDLLAETDSGPRNDDNITNVDVLKFKVEDTQTDDVVELLLEDDVIAMGIAEGSSIVIETNALSIRGDGQYTVQSRTMRDDVVVDSSQIRVTYDSTGPTLDRGQLPTSVQANREWSLSLATFEHAPVLYELLGESNSASIVGNSLRWRPTLLGTHRFAVRLTDAAGNSRIETFQIEVVSDPTVPSDEAKLVELQVVATDLDGNEISNVEVGQPFQIEFRAIDLRDGFRRDGVYAAYADLEFDPSVLAVFGDDPITHVNDFLLAPKGKVLDGVIDELGAALNVVQSSNQRVSTVATVRMQATAVGTARFHLMEADDRASDVLLFGVDDVIPKSQVVYGVTELSITASWHNEDLASDVNGDGAVSPRDALAIINFLSFHGASVSTVTTARGGEGEQFQYDVVADGWVTPRDVLAIINRLIEAEFVSEAEETAGDFVKTIGEENDREDSYQDVGSRGSVRVI